MTRFVLTCAVLFAGGLRAQDTAAAALEKLRSLAGEWEGTFQWIGRAEPMEPAPMKASYTLSGKGSTIVENLMMDGPAPSMMSVYHLDGSDLRMTHFCLANNQPRLKASRIDLAKGAIDFAFVDVTNLRTPETGHVHGSEIRFIDADHITIRFLYQAGSKQTQESIVLKRVAAKPGR